MDRISFPKLRILGMVSIISFSSFSMIQPSLYNECLLPDLYTLQQRFQKLGYSHLLEKERLDTIFANKKFSVYGVACIVNSSVDKYVADVNDPTITLLSDEIKFSLISCILQEYIDKNSLRSFLSLDFPQNKLFLP